MKCLRRPNNFFDLDKKASSFNSSRAIILPVPFERTTTGIKGTKNGPKYMQLASRSVMHYDEELGTNPCDTGIGTLPAIGTNTTTDTIFSNITDVTSQILDLKKLPIIIGGEHSISAASVLACKKKYAGLSVLQIDAHCDLLDVYDGTKKSHACAGRRMHELTGNVVPVGIRSIFAEEALFIKKNKIPVFFAKDISQNDDWHQKTLSKLSDKVYITLDLDGLDPSLIPHVGNPEPGGLLYYPFLRFIAQVFQEKEVVGFDIVELSPKKNDVSYVSDFAAAKILYKMIGYKFCR